MKLLVLFFVTLKQIKLQIISPMSSTETVYTLHSEWLLITWLTYSTTILDKTVSVCHLKHHFRLPCTAAITVNCNSQDTTITCYAHVERVHNIMQF